MLGTHEKKLSGSHLGVMLMATTMLVGCLPDGDSVRAKRLAEFNETQAASFADSLSSFSVSGQGTLSARFAAGVPTATGRIANSPDGRMAYGYCQDTTVAPVNHMMLTWFIARDAANNFSVKGVGTDAGAGIVAKLSDKTTPESIGVMGDNNTVTLRGPRDNGRDNLNVGGLAGCGTLNIPNGSPVIVVENMQAPLLNVTESDSFEYRTDRCADPTDIGAITYRKRISDANWPVLPYDNTCNGAVSTRAVTINNNNAARLVDAADVLGSGNLQGTLNNLASNKSCREAAYEENEEEEGPDSPQDDTKPEDFSTCDEEIAVIDYEGPGDNVIGAIIDESDPLVTTCGAGRTGVVAQNDPYNTVSYRGHEGVLNLFNGWSGSATYIRYLRNADGTSGNAAGHGNAAQWSAWTGLNLSCNRTERLTISCADVFPQYSDATRYRPAVVTGMIMGRTNQVRGWANTSTLTPNDPLPPSQGWSLAQPNCAWDELRTFNTCPTSLGAPPTIAGLSCTPGSVVLVQPGVNKRRIQATATFGDVTIGEWEVETPLQCRQTYNCTGSCQVVGDWQNGGGPTDGDNDGDNDGSDPNDGDPGVGAGDGEGDGSCFVTTAVARVVGEADDGPTLTSLRMLRDMHTAGTGDGGSRIKLYYIVAPEIVSRINQLENSQEIWTNIHHQWIAPIRSLVEQGEWEQADRLYSKMVKRLTVKYLLLDKRPLPEAVRQALRQRLMQKIGLISR